jgi:hypothetical protein
VRPYASSFPLVQILLQQRWQESRGTSSAPRRAPRASTIRGRAEGRCGWIRRRGSGERAERSDRGRVRAMRSRLPLAPRRPQT